MLIGGIRKRKYRSGAVPSIVFGGGLAHSLSLSLSLSLSFATFSVAAAFLSFCAKAKGAGPTKNAKHTRTRLRSSDISPTELETCARFGVLLLQPRTKKALRSHKLTGLESFPLCVPYYSALGPSGRPHTKAKYVILFFQRGLFQMAHHRRLISSSSKKSKPPTFES